MDYSLFTEEIFDERYAIIPASLRAVFESEQTKRVLAGIEREHYLSPEKCIILEQLVGLTLMGFISLRNLSREVGEQLFINFEHARVLTDEIYNRLLAPYEEEITENYKPIEEVLAEKEQIEEAIQNPISKTDEPIQKNEEIIKPSFFLKKDDAPTTIKIETSESAPLILHEEPTFFSRTADEKRPETPFNKFIPTSSESTEKKIPKARIESGSINPLSFLKREEKTTVHYNEIRTGLKPAVGAEQEVINIAAFEKREEPIQPNTTVAQKPEVVTITPTTSPVINRNLVEMAANPQKIEKKPSWISSLFKQNEKPTPSLIPEIKIEEQKPTGPETIQGNTINLKL